MHRFVLRALPRHKQQIDECRQRADKQDNTHIDVMVHLFPCRFPVRRLLRRHVVLDFQVNLEVLSAVIMDQGAVNAFRHIAARFHMQRPTKNQISLRRLIISRVADVGVGEHLVAVHCVIFNRVLCQFLIQQCQLLRIVSTMISNIPYVGSNSVKRVPHIIAILIAPLKQVQRLLPCKRVRQQICDPAC